MFKEEPMTVPRSQLISYEATPFYHIISRCVRHSYLCGIDPDTQKDYEYRKQWIEDRIRILSTLFAIEVCAYAVMSNHYHLILKAIPEEASKWGEREVARRWLSIFGGKSPARKFARGEALKPHEIEIVNEQVITWRKRLTSISWLMKCLNEPIARQANKEDGKEGNFWISRFRSHALMDEHAVLTAMVYVDLNPVRAGISETPENSKYTSVKERISPQFDLSEAIKSYCQQGGFSEYLLDKSNPLPIRNLARFKGGEKIESRFYGINYYLRDYLKLVDYSGRIIRQDKKGHIDNKLTPILERLGLSQKDWIENCQQFEAVYTDRFAPRLLFSG